MHPFRIDCSERCVTKSCLYSTCDPRMCNSYRNGVVQSVAANPVFVYKLSHMLDKVENAWFIHSR